MDEHRQRAVPAVPQAPAGPRFVLEDGTVASLEAGKPLDFRARPREVDVCFVFDTTGSMSNKIDGLMSCMVDLVTELAGLSLDWRITAVPFGDLTVPGDRVVRDLPFVATSDQAEHLLRTMPRFDGGGNLGESSAEAMLAAFAKAYRPSAVKVFVLLTDEPALETSQAGTARVTDALAREEVVCFVASPDLPYFRHWAAMTGGDWYPIGAYIDTAAVLRFLRRLLQDVAQIANAVHELGGGSVRAYRALGSGPTDQ